MMIRPSLILVPAVVLGCALLAPAGGARPVHAADADDGQSSQLQAGRRLFERETFGGNGRTCRTCHSRETGTVSPSDAQERLASDPNDPLFRADGSDDGLGQGVVRMLTDATILMRIPLASKVRPLKDPAP